MDMLSSAADLIILNAGYVVPVVAIFARLSLFVFLLPGLGEIAIPVRVRAIVALLMTWMVLPIIGPSIDIDSLTISTSLALIAKEAFHGFVLGFAFRAMVYGLQVTGSVISQSMSLSQIFGEGITTQPNMTLGTLFMLTGITLAVTADLHIFAFGVFIGTFETFPLGTTPDTDIAAFWAVRKFADVFNFSLALALPFMLLNFVYNLILGFLNRAMPQLMVSFVGMPAITGAGLFLLVLSAAGTLMIWLAEYNRAFDLPGVGP
jgi:flagellar biosynthetic protein FliR